ncbi:DNA repair protein RadA [uncultured Ruminococcus sp.]|uniref:DNA repair protein RadA n=1 Tax=Massiliimalia timonensis TaxID=1987501 RepID=A0A8J6P2U5_9FIRM|nr:DNA repair protein RadA [Massiliimalia timonensis]MBC8611856.1 DNA repair protein RadA [Massiliimalia timonensis]SCH54748.1 DNA repair protein RadA [uncultured Clostridium sp.]SCH65841.1 DNA repair protein RadA [uncultured Ruminococcus sp.]
MAKTKEMYVCRSCGYETPKWFGKCPGCGGWNTLEMVEAAPVAEAGKKVSATATGRQSEIYRINSVDVNDEIRFHTGVSELDRVLGGGIVKGSVVLLGGDPGIGKSTLLLQICEYLGEDLKILYVSGEESVRQIKLRANRLGVNSENLFLLADTNVERIANTILAQQPDLVMVDSIQTMNIEKLQSSPGSVMQVRESTNAFLHLAKSEDIPIIIVGHVNKDGAIAGPKVLEHIVDAVLHFEGDRNQNFRILRAVKNRFGSTNEIGVFEMLDGGLQEVENPSMMLLQGRPEEASGTCVACVMEGTRPILAEVQALVCKTVYGNPRRTATGFDYNRLALILAVLEKRCGYYFSSLDAYLNVVGGLRLDEPAADLSIALALISGLRDKPISEKVLAFGEIGLTGEVRSVSNIVPRIKEAHRLGFQTCIVSKHSLRELKNINPDQIEIIGVSTIREAVQKVLGI